MRERAMVRNQIVRRSFGAVNKDKVIRGKSSSGGIFTLIATQVIRMNGIVFGAAMSDDCHSVVHCKVTDIADLEKLRTSKYVQSKIEDTYQDAKSYLDNGKL